VTIDYETPTDDGFDPRRRRGLLAAAAAGVVVLVALVVLRPGADEPAPAPGVTASPGASTAPPLAKGGHPRGPAKANPTGTRQVYGVPRGFPHTEAGAVEAATAANEAIYKVLSSPDFVIGEIGRDLSVDGKGSFDPNDTAAWRKRQGLNAAGQVVDPKTGQINPQLTFYNSCYAEYGTYRVTSSKPDEVTVEMWFPCLVGPGSDDDLSRAKVYWIMPRSTFVWVRGDWHDKVSDLLDNPPEPTLPSLINVSFAEREKLLPGDGWLLYADATEKPFELGSAS
jgi:hypothetical protein